MGNPRPGTGWFPPQADSIQLSYGPARESSLA